MIFRSRLGRPLKYRKYLIQLKNHIIYTPTRIIDQLMRNGMLRGWNEDQKTSLRHSLAALAKSRAFPSDGDGKVRGPKRRRRFWSGWFGWRWKTAAGRALLDLF